MITPADDFPLHQTPEPVAARGGEPNAYDRYFFNGYSENGETFFALAMGFYPGLGVVDAAFSVQHDGVQHNVRASKSSDPIDLLDLRVGPIQVDVDIPLRRLRLHIDHEVLQATLEFNARCEVIKEPRFVREVADGIGFDYTRMTQNGVWDGTISIHGSTLGVESLYGTRDRSWGVRPLGNRAAVPSARHAAQFFWLWTPINFDDACAFYHLNADGDGEPWNEHGEIVSLLTDAGPPPKCGSCRGGQVSSSLTLGEDRRVVQMSIHRLSSQAALSAIPEEVEEVRLELKPSKTFYMSGLGYTHPVWGHGLNHGSLDVGYDQIDLDRVDESEPIYRHVQVLCEALMFAQGSDDLLKRGHGIIEQLIIGRFAPLGLD